jgi:glycosyltransferase involved in cell wall biosynthesis
LRRLVDDGALRTTMGSAGRARAVARYTDAAMARAYEALYADVLGTAVAGADAGFGPRPSP